MSSLNRVDVIQPAKTESGASLGQSVLVFIGLKYSLLSNEAGQTANSPALGETCFTAFHDDLI